MGALNPAQPATDVLDLRHLPAPEPFERALEAAEALEPGGVLELLTPRWPAPLLDVLAVRGFWVEAEARADGTAHIRLGDARPRGIADGPARS